MSRLLFNPIALWSKILEFIIKMAIFASRYKQLILPFKDMVNCGKYELMKITNKKGYKICIKKIYT